MKKEAIEYLANIAVIRNHFTLLLNTNRKFTKNDRSLLSKKIEDFDDLFLNTIKLGDIPQGFADDKVVVEKTRKTLVFNNTNFEKELKDFSVEEDVNSDQKDCLGDSDSCESSLPTKKEKINEVSTTDEDALLLKKRLEEEKKKLQKKSKGGRPKNTSGK
jgi:hypothetical protein